MGPVITGGGGGEIGLLVGLMEILKDPKKYQAALTDLETKRAEIAEQLKAAAEKFSEAVRKEKDLVAREAALGEMGSKIAARAEQLDKDEARVSAAKAELEGKLKTLDRDILARTEKGVVREKQLSAAEAELDRKQSVLDRDMAAAAKAREELESKLEQMKRIAG